MGRPRKKGLDYFPVDTDIFKDPAIRVLMNRYGSDGFTLYMYVLAETYRTEGYYLEVDEDTEYVMLDDMKMKVEKVRQILAYLYSRSLLEKIEIRDRKHGHSITDAGILSTPVTAITSTGIQRRFQNIVKTRAQKNPVEVKEELWLLEEKETQPFIKMLPSASNSGKKASNSEKNTSNSEKNALKESKGKKRKEKESKSAEPARIYLSDFGANEAFEQYLSMRREIDDVSESQINALIGKLIEITEDPAVQRKVIREATIHRWKSFFPLKGDEPKGGSGIRKGSFYNFEERQRSEEEKKELEKRLLGIPPAKEDAG